MEIEFCKKKVQKLCERKKFATQELGPPCANKLHARIADIRAAHDIFDLPPTGKPHPLKGNRNGQFALNLPNGKRLILIPADDPTPLNEDESIDWSRVTRVRIIEIGDYHD